MLCVAGCSKVEIFHLAVSEENNANYKDNEAVQRLVKASLQSLTPSASSSLTLSDSTKKPSMLLTGFGLRNVESLQRALLDDEQRRQALLARYGKHGDEFEECLSLSSASSSSKARSKTATSYTAGDSGSDVSTRRSFSLAYLMGIANEVAAEEAGIEEMRKPIGARDEGMELEGEDESEKKLTLAMRQARKYLRQHKIFEFFQFIIAHMLSALPDNPIQFIIDLLDKCLLYRSGFGNPPLLYEKAHLEQLFFLMDRMRTGFVEFSQYETGMKTLGICNYDKKPPLSTEGLVSQETFVEEAYDCLTDLFVDMVRRRGGQITPPSLVTPPPTEVQLASVYPDSGGE